MLRKLIYFLTIAFYSVMLSSCVTTPVVKPAVYPQSPAGVVGRQNVYHVVGPYETVWRISKMYDVPIADIGRANKLQNIRQLEMGQRLLIPNAMPIKPVVYLYPSQKWKYIIIHHSASDEGSSLDIYRVHKSKGWDTVGYHFVIDNGSLDKVDGQIEAAPRWIKQLDGAHCKAGDMNSRGIGICLIGNFSQDEVSRKQMDSLVYLANMLRDYYNIPTQNILGHGQAPGARTECPGKKFPYQKFFRELNAKNR